VHGAARWLSVFGLRVQPSEFAKLATVVMLARHLAHPVRRPEKLSSVARAGLLAVLPFALIAMEPDLGTATVLIPVTAAMLLTAGMTFRMLLLFLAGGLAALPASWFLLGDYQRERLLTFIDPGRDPLGAGWNKIQSELAVGSGGLTGKGFLEGTQNVLGFLPRTVAPTDFIFSVIAEEAGFIGSALVLALFAVMISCGMSTALTARDRFGQILTVGLITMLFVHVFINTAMTIGLMPITGLPLPLISYGGSFMVSTMGALGLIQSVYVRRHQH
jgi:rod shape determining protein RodA